MVPFLEGFLNRVHYYISRLVGHKGRNGSKRVPLLAYGVFIAYPTINKSRLRANGLSLPLGRDIEFAAWCTKFGLACHPLCASSGFQLT